MTYIYILLSDIFVAILELPKKQHNNNEQSNTEFIDEPHSWKHLQLFLCKLIIVRTNKQSKR